MMNPANLVELIKKKEKKMDLRNSFAEALICIAVVDSEAPAAAPTKVAPASTTPATAPTAAATASPPLPPASKPNS